MADVWPIENVWAILKQKVMEQEPKSKEQLKKVMNKAWQKINKDKAFCKRLISSIPLCLQAVIDLDGRQITKEDY